MTVEKSDTCMEISEQGMWKDLEGGKKGTPN